MAARWRCLIKQIHRDWRWKCKTASLSRRKSKRKRKRFERDVESEFLFWNSRHHKEIESRGCLGKKPRWKDEASCRETRTKRNETRATERAKHRERTQLEQESERNRKLWFRFSKSQPRWTISSRRSNNQCSEIRMKYSNAVNLTSKNTASARLKGVAQHQKSLSSSSD